MSQEGIRLEISKRSILGDVVSQARSGHQGSFASGAHEIIKTKVSPPKYKSQANIKELARENHFLQENAIL